jgi:hypothetical protein
MLVLNLHILILILEGHYDSMVVDFFTPLPVIDSLGVNTGHKK